MLPGMLRNFLPIWKNRKRILKDGLTVIASTVEEFQSGSIGDIRSPTSELSPQAPVAQLDRATVSGLVISSNSQLIQLFVERICWCATDCATGK